MHRSAAATVDGTAALVAHGLSKSFAGREAVVDVDLRLPTGRLHGLLGPNGGRKTTLLRMLLGLVRPDAGTIATPAGEMSPTEPRGRRGIAGFVDTPSFYPYLSASRNLELLSAWDGPGSHTRVEELLELVGLADRAHSRVRGFSTGMRQRLGLAAALISRPDLLIVDEPTSGLDPAAARELHAVLLSIAAAGRTVLLSSHDLDEVERLCTEVTVLRHGHVVYTGGIVALRERAGRRVWRLETSDDTTATTLGSTAPGVDIAPGPGGALWAAGEQQGLDRYLIGLAAAGVAVRGLSRDELPFETLYLQLTDEAAGEPTASHP